jgi:hypothetical protein
MDVRGIGFPIHDVLQTLDLDRFDGVGRWEDRAAWDRARERRDDFDARNSTRLLFRFLARGLHRPFPPIASVGPNAFERAARRAEFARLMPDGKMRTNASIARLRIPRAPCL